MMKCKRKAWTKYNALEKHYNSVFFVKWHKGILGYLFLEKILIHKYLFKNDEANYFY